MGKLDATDHFLLHHRHYHHHRHHHHHHFVISSSSAPHSCFSLLIHNAFLALIKCYDIIMSTAHRVDHPSTLGGRAATRYHEHRSMLFRCSSINFKEAAAAAAAAWKNTTTKTSTSACQPIE